MVLTPTQGKEAKLVVGAGDTEVLGVRSANPAIDWNSEDIMHFQDDSPSTLLNYKNWTIPVTLTLDKAETGQLAIFDACDGGTSLAFKLYPDADVATSYWSGTAVITNWKEGVDGQKIQTGDCTFKPYLGSALTWTHA